MCGMGGREESDNELPADSRQVPPQKEPTLDTLLGRVKAIGVEPQRRAVLSLLGLCVGDTLGVPFEFNAYNFRRADEARDRGEEDLRQLVLECVMRRIGKRGLALSYARGFSDDTVCADLKMQAIAQFSALRENPEFCRSEPEDLLWRCFLCQLLAWSYGPARGRLFQGYGQFTKALLRPLDIKGPDLVSPLPNPGVPGCNTMPSEMFIQYATEYVAGRTDWTPSSYGNGAVMSFAPQTIAELAPVPADNRVPAFALKYLSDTHQNVKAKQASGLLDEILRAIYSGEVQTTQQLRGAVRKTKTWQALLAEPLEFIYPVMEFDTFLDEARGDIKAADVPFWVARLLRIPEATASLEPPMSGGPQDRPVLGLHMGKLLRTASNIHDADPGDRTRFSQRGLNTVMIAIWSCAGASSVWEWISRLLYVGGDVDTIGATSGQIAFPLMQVEDACDAFANIACLRDTICKRPSALVAQQGAVRFLHRALLFCTGDWSGLLKWQRLVDPVYPGITNERGTDFDRNIPGKAVRVLWVDRSFHERTGGDRATRGHVHATEEAQRKNLLEVISLADASLAVRELQTKFRGKQSDMPTIDAVVTEMGYCNQGKYRGFDLLEAISRLYPKDSYLRPLFVGLTGRYDRQLAQDVRQFHRAHLVRRDKPEDIIAQLLRGQYQAGAIAVAPASPMTSMPQGSRSGTFRM